MAQIADQVGKQATTNRRCCALFAFNWQLNSMVTFVDAFSGYCQNEQGTDVPGHLP